MMELPRRDLSAADLADDALIAMGQDTFRLEADGLHQVADALDGRFAAAVRCLLACSGRVLVTGLGKSGIMARKLAATLTSTGTPSHFIHPVEAAHGDLGVVRGADVIIGISRGGNNTEVVSLLGRCREFGMQAIAITCEDGSHLAAAADIVLHTPIRGEACPLGLTPTTSTAVAMAMGDALCLALIRLRGFQEKDFALFHPSGALGRRLLVKVSDLMHTGEELPVVTATQTLRESLPEIVGKRLGGTCVVDGDGRMVGLCVDGDIKRTLLENSDALERPITEAMNARPTTIKGELLALSALRIMEQRASGPVTLLLVVDDDNRPVGLLHIHDILRAGLL